MSGMSEFTWYSRLAVWIGAAILLVQAVQKQGTSFITLVAVLLLSLGFLAFLAGLSRDGLEQRRLTGEPPASADGEAFAVERVDSAVPAGRTVDQSSSQEVRSQDTDEP
ncbi:MAG TPA: hypothetical protein VF898_10225 [Chloroflexota bacterium]